MVKQKLKKIFTNWRIILLLVLLVFAVVAINPRPGQDGLAIRSVAVNSSAALGGIQSPDPTVQPVYRERLISLNNRPISTVQDYLDAVAPLRINSSVLIKTNQGTYRLTTKEAFEEIELDETEFVTTQEFQSSNKTINGTVQEVVELVNVTREVPVVQRNSLGVEDLGLDLYPAPQSNIIKGLDLQGGTRVLLQPERTLTPEDLSSVIDSLTQRLNVYGLSDLEVTEAGDLSGNQYVRVEIAGASESELRSLLAQQGKFEAVIDGQTVFSGGDDVTYVCRSPTCSGIDTFRGGCQPSGSGGFLCPFYFQITLSGEAAQRQAIATDKLDVIESEGGGQVLSKPLELYLDDVLVSELNIGESLKGQAATTIQITGSGVGPTIEAAAQNAIEIEMKELQTVLITGSLPVKLNVVKVDSVSPTLGAGFIANSIIMALVVIIAVAIVVAVRYRKAIVALPIIITMISELILILGVASLIRWNIDLASIAGIIAAIGTGVDHQIVITDETLRGQGNHFGWKERIKRAFAIILLAFFTVLAAMFPLLLAGAGLLKGFALITIIGAALGVFITRPAFSALLEILIK